MGFNKKFIDQEILESKLKDLDSLLNSDMMIIQDEWSSEFIDKYKKLRKKLERLNNGSHN